MSLATSALLSTVKEPFPKLISPKVHSFIDYGHAIFFSALGCSAANTTNVPQWRLSALARSFWSNPC